MPVNTQTGAVIAWITADAPARERVFRILDGNDGFSGRRASAKFFDSPEWRDLPGRVACMADFIEHLIRWDDGSEYRSTCGAGRGSSAPLSEVRAALMPDDWYEIHWSEVKSRDAVDWIAVRDAAERFRLS